MLSINYDKFFADLNSSAHVCELKRTRHGPLSTYDTLHDKDWTYVKTIQKIMTYSEILNQYSKDISKFLLLVTYNIVIERAKRSSI